MTTKPARSPGRSIAAWIVAIVLGAFGILVASQTPLAASSVITGFVILIVGVVLAILIAIRRPDRALGQTDADADADASTPATRRIRQAFYGQRSTDSDRLGSALRTSGRLGVGLLGPAPGPFDNPPEEAVELDPDHLPWELRDSSESHGTRP